MINETDASQPATSLIAKLIRRVSELIVLRNEIEEKAEDHEWQRQELAIQQREDSLMEAISALEPQSIDDCAVMAIRLCNDFDTYRANHHPEDEDKEGAAILRMLQALAAALVGHANLPQPFVDMYFGTNRVPWSKRAEDRLAELSAMPVRPDYRG